MRKVALWAALLAAVSMTMAQEAVSRMGSLNIVKEVKPPILSVVDGSLQFVDNTGNNAIDAGEKCSVVFSVQNSGMGDAIGCVAHITLQGATQGLSVQDVTLPIIKVGQRQRVEIPLRASMQTTTGQVTLTVAVKEPMGFDIPPFELAVNTHAFDAPLVKVVDYALGSAGALQKNVPFDLQVAVQNMKQGRADNVSVDVVLPQGVYLLSDNSKSVYKSLEGGRAQTISYKIIVPTAYAQSTVPVQVKLHEQYGKYAENRTIELPLNQQIAQHSIVINESVQEQKTEVAQVTIGSDVDKNIPMSKTRDELTYVLIIANEQYQEVAKVPFAARDGEVFRQYCERTLGISTKHIKLYQNATLGNMRAGLSWLRQALSVNPDAQAIVYYTGHGIPDEATRSAYLLPVDGLATDRQTAYSVDALYRELGAMNKPVTVFLDACFSGAKRDGQMLAQAKGVAIKVQSGEPQGRMVVFSAATGDETAGFFRQQQHGMFTYWLLKKMQETGGNVSYDELGRYLNSKVRQSSFDENGKVQTPTVMNGRDAADWQTWRLH